jgi:hypothetical protein
MDMDSRSFLRPRLLVAFMGLIPLLGCDDGSTDPFDDEDIAADRGPSGKADGAQQLSGTCSSPTGSDACGGEGHGGCWCDEACAEYGDCCPDKRAICDDEEPAPPAPPAIDPWSDDFCSDGPIPRELGWQYDDTGFRTLIPMVEHGVRTYERSCNPDTGECASWGLVSAPQGEAAVIGRYRGDDYVARAPELEQRMELWASPVGLFVEAGLGSLALVLYSAFEDDGQSAHMAQGIGLGRRGSLEDSFEIRSAPGCLRWESYRARMAAPWSGITGEFPAHEVRTIGYAIFDPPPQ